VLLTVAAVAWHDDSAALRSPFIDESFTRASCNNAVRLARDRGFRSG
jgi:hypothetical protein